MNTTMIQSVNDFPCEEDPRPRGNSLTCQCEGQSASSIAYFLAAAWLGRCSPGAHQAPLLVLTRCSPGVLAQLRRARSTW